MNVLKANIHVTLNISTKIKKHFCKNMNLLNSYT